jgi:hypothetical protein
MKEVAPSIFVIQETELPAVIHELGVSPEMLSEAALAGEQARDRSTGHHPPAAPGLFFWCECVRTLRDRLVPQKWTKDETDNYSTVVSPDRRVAIAVATGGTGTGQWGVTPTTAHPKGQATMSAIQLNQLDLFPRGSSAAPIGAPITWLLLVSRLCDGDKEYIVSEISRPGSITASGWIVTWETRYILPRIEITFTPPPGGTPDEGEEYDIPVIAK